MFQLRQQILREGTQQTESWGGGGGDGSSGFVGGNKSAYDFSSASVEFGALKTLTHT